MTARVGKRSRVRSVVQVVLTLATSTTSEEICQSAPLVEAYSEIAISKPTPPYYQGHQMLDSSPQIALGKDAIIAVSELQSGFKQSAWVVSGDGGRTWSEPALFESESEVVGEDYVRGSPSVVSDGRGGFIAAVPYVRRPIAVTALYHATPTDSAFRWSGPEFSMPFVGGVTDTMRFPEWPAMAVDVSSNDVHIIHTRGERVRGSSVTTARIVITSKIDGAWTNPQSLSGPAGEGARVVVCDDGVVFVVWHDMEGRQIVGRRSEDRGRTFGETIVLADINANFSLSLLQWRSGTGVSVAGRGQERWSAPRMDVCGVAGGCRRDARADHRRGDRAGAE